VGEKFVINFKWSDNMQNEGDIMDFYVNGDVAPGGRFKYQYASYELYKESTFSLGKVITIVGAVLFVGLAVLSGILVVKKRKK